MAFNSGKKLIMGYISFPQSEVAKRVAKVLVVDKLAACAKVVNGINTFYMWEGKLQEDDEVYLLIKTEEEKVNKVKEVLDKEHPYKIYEFLYHPVESGNSRYLEWAESMMKKI